LNKIADVEKIEISQEEINEEIEKQAAYYRVTVDQLRDALKNMGGEVTVADRLRSRKAVELVFDKAKIADGEWVDPNQAVTDEPEPVKAEKPKKAKAKTEKAETAKAEKPKAKKAKE
jgi:trigger factor